MDRALNIEQAKKFIDDLWDESITPTLMEYIQIPNKSPAFDPAWEQHGFMDEAVELAHAWVCEHLPAEAKSEVIRIAGRTPVLLIEIPGETEGNILLYGHLDKQPEMTGWREGLGPWKAVLEDEKLYGRGGADDGYAVFASLTAINAVRAQGIAHPRCILLIECCEESGSYDLPAYIDHLHDRLGAPDLVICLDSGAGNYDQLWLTTSLRGLISGTLSVDVLREGLHSGDASGVVASSFRIARQLIDRLEDVKSGEIRLESLNVEIPAQRVEQAIASADTLGEMVSERFPYVGSMRPVTEDRPSLLLNRTWRPALSVTGVGGMPTIENAGNVLRPGTQLQLSMRTPPTVKAEDVYHELKALLESEPPYGAKVSFQGDGASGWHSPLLSDWLSKSLDEVSNSWFGKPCMYMGEGGTIPFMGMLGEKFPKAQFMITGVLGPNSNAHGPNEFLHLGMAKRLTGCVAQLISMFGRSPSA